MSVKNLVIVAVSLTSASFVVNAPAMAVTLGFEELPSTSLLSGTPPANTVLTDDFAADGIIFGKAGTSAGVAVTNHPSGVAFGSNAIAGLNAAGDLVFALSADIFFNFVLPGTTTPAVTDSVSFTIGDIGGDLDIFDVRAFDLNNQLLFSQNVSDNSFFPVTINAAGINRVEVDFDNTSSAGYGLDNLSFNTPVPIVVSVPEPNSLLGLFAIGTLGAASTLKRKLNP